MNVQGAWSQILVVNMKSLSMLISMALSRWCALLYREQTQLPWQCKHKYIPHSEPFPCAAENRESSLSSSEHIWERRMRLSHFKNIFKHYGNQDSFWMTPCPGRYKTWSSEAKGIREGRCFFYSNNVQIYNECTLRRYTRTLTALEASINSLGAVYPSLQKS